MESVFSEFVYITLLKTKELMACMGLTNHKEEQLKKQPIIETKLFKSKSGKHVVFQTIVTEIKPVAYMQAVLDSEAEEYIEA